VIPKDVLECPFVQDSQDIQRIGKLYGQRKFQQDADVGFTLLGTRLALQPDDVITINEANYGGNYAILIDSIKITNTLELQFTCTKFTTAFDDWEDLSPTALTIPTDDTTLAWQPSISGPQTDGNVGRAAFDVWGKEYLTVGAVANQGKETDIQKALNAVKQAGGGAIYLLNGTHNKPAAGHPFYIPDVNLEIVGQSQGGVILQNNAGYDLFTLHNLTKTFNFHQFSIASQNVSTFSKMFNFYGDTDADNTASLIIRDITETLEDNASDDGDYGIFVSKGQTGSIIFDKIKALDGLRHIYFSNKYDSIMYCLNGDFSNSLSGSLGIKAATAKIIGNSVRDGRSGTSISLADCDSGLAQSNDISGTAGSGISVSGSSKPQIIDNAINLALASSTTQTGIALQFSVAGHVKGNRTIISNSSTGITIGLHFTGVQDSVCSGNKIEITEADTTNNHYGILLGGLVVYSHRNVISENQIDGVSNNAQDIGISIASGCNNNQGSDNVTYRVGTSISDSGTGNTVTAKDV